MLSLLNYKQSDALAKLVTQQEIVNNDYSHNYTQLTIYASDCTLQPSRFQSIAEGWRCDNQSSAHFDIADGFDSHGCTKKETNMRRSLKSIQPIITSHAVGQKRVLLSRAEAGCNLTQIAITDLRAGEVALAHIHPDMQEGFYVLDG